MKHLLLVLTLLSFMVGADAFAESIAEKTSAALQKFKNIYNSEVPHNERTGLELLRTELVSSLPDGKNSALSVAYTETCIQYTLKYTQKALQEPELLARDLTILEGLKFRWLSSPIYSTTENLYNAQNGSLMGKYKSATSDYILLRSQVSRNEIEKEFSFGDEQLKERIKAEVSKEFLELEKNSALLKEQALKIEKDKYKALEKWRQDTRILDKYEAQKNKLNDLILKNDRKGVRKMIEAYLPWQVMEPFETQAWKLWLEAIEHPNKENTVTALRGVDYTTDKIQRLTLANGQERIAFMAPVLTKNQGSYTRRLRSLTTKREQNGRFGSSVPGVMMTEQWKEHSRNPRGSSFLSFTIAPEVAMAFKGAKLVKSPEGKDVYTSNGGLLAVRIDARRMFPNLTSGHLEEIEYLAPLVIFPDEIVAFQDFADTTKDNFKEFYDKVMQKTGLNFLGNYTKMMSEYVPAGRKFMMEASKQPLAGQCSAVFH